MPSRLRRLLRHAAILALSVGIGTCSDNNGPDPAEPTSLGGPALATVSAPAVVLAAGDIASCSNTGDSKTAALLDGIPGEVLALGDLAYDNGSASEFTNCYDPTWGRHKARTHPVPGNRDYVTSNAAPYYAYFGAAAGAAGEGYYSFNVGSWHLVALNSNIAMESGSAQNIWLKSDLASNSQVCTLAYFHHPLYSSYSDAGTGGITYSSVRPLYDVLYAAGAEVILAGHRHFYERMAPTKPDGTIDPVRGIP